MAHKRFKDYEDYFMNRTTADIMEEYAENREEWVSIPLENTSDRDLQEESSVHSKDQ